jgi:conjugal transfer ATP-binding protein TraC
VAEALIADEDPAHRLKDIGQQLFSFTSAGEYGRYFNGPNTFEPNNRFIVCELEELKGRKHLQRVVLMQLMYQIGQQMYLGDRAQRKMLVVDEAWDLLATAETKSFIETSYRRARKYNGSTVTITQSVSDYWSNEGALAIVENSANMYLLGQKPESIAIAKKESRMPFGEWGYQMLESVHTVKGQYSEAFFITEFGQGVGRLVLSEFQKLLFSTDATDVAAIQTLTKRGMHVQDAINTLLQQRGIPVSPTARPQERVAA